MVSTGGAPIAPAVKRFLQDCFIGRFHEGYGATEVHVTCAVIGALYLFTIFSCVQMAAETCVYLYFTLPDMSICTKYIYMYVYKSGDPARSRVWQLVLFS